MGAEYYWRIDTDYDDCHCQQLRGLFHSSLSRYECQRTAFVYAEDCAVFSGIPNKTRCFLWVNNYSWDIGFGDAFDPSRPTNGSSYFHWDCICFVGKSVVCSRHHVVDEKGKPQKDLTGEASHFFARLLTSTGNIITKRPKRVLGFFVVFFTICTLGLFFFKVAPDNNKVLPEKHQFNEAIRIIDKDFGGSKMLNVMIEGDAKDPKLLNKLIECEEKLTALPQVGSVTSLATVVVEISKAMNDPDSEAYGKIPDSREAVAQYILLYSMDGDPEDLERFVDFNYTNLLMTIQFKADKIADIDEVLDNLQTVFGDDSPYQINPGGYALVEKELSEAVVTGQNYSLIFAFFAIIILLAIIFRSITAGLMGSIPLVFAVFCTFGLMGWLGIELNIVTALLSSISIGLGVDFTIHIFWRIKWELALEKDYPEAIKNTLITIGRGITINAFSVMMGFAVLFLSGFPLIRSFAFLIIISLFLCLICALVLIPALSLVFKPKFLEKSF